MISLPRRKVFFYLRIDPKTKKKTKVGFYLSEVLVHELRLNPNGLTVPTICKKHKLHYNTVASALKSLVKINRVKLKRYKIGERVVSNVYFPNNWRLK